MLQALSVMKVIDVPDSCLDFFKFIKLSHIGFYQIFVLGAPYKVKFTVKSEYLSVNTFNILKRTIAKCYIISVCYSDRLLCSSLSGIYELILELELVRQIRKLITALFYGQCCTIVIHLTLIVFS